MSEYYDGGETGDSGEYPEHTEPEALIDIDGDGRADLAYYDADGDGHIDHAAWDVDGDGRADYVNAIEEPAYAETNEYAETTENTEYTPNSEYTESNEYTENSTYTDDGSFYANNNIDTAVSTNPGGDEGYIALGDGEFVSWG
jgi:hypothetical protein